MPHSHRVVIIGGGFGGLYAAIAVRKADVSVTLIDRRNFHLFQPLLYQVATGGLSPANIATPLRSILRKQKNCEVVLGEVSKIDVDAKSVTVGDNSFAYDSLIVAAGAGHSYFGHDEWEPLAPGLKTIEDATNIRRRVLQAFEAAEVETDAARRAAWMTFVVVGGGPTGVELSGAQPDGGVVRQRRAQGFSDSRTSVVLVEGRTELRGHADNITPKKLGR